MWSQAIPPALALSPACFSVLAKRAFGYLREPFPRPLAGSVPCASANTQLCHFYLMLQRADVNDGEHRVYSLQRECDLLRLGPH